ncbi:hypothetical protein AX17_004184 [Amanita inopinata Kibby_2008]|nr:hypothetical protein AX17_004184 [Amanita inopinata Kibby_2008]
MPFIKKRPAYCKFCEHCTPSTEPQPHYNAASEAAKLFDPNAKADTVLRSSDSLDFFVWGPLLSFISPVFDSMFSLNRGEAVEQNESKNGLPVVPLAEDGQTLRLLLLLIYPYINEPQFDNAGLFLKVYLAAQKYCMEILEGKLRKLILGSELIKREPFRVYVIAISLGHEYKNVATKAEKYTLTTPMQELSYVDELCRISGADLYRYMGYRLRCEGTSKPASTVDLLSSRGSPTAVSTAPIHLDVPNSASQSKITSPFESSAEADVILRSSDSIDFFVSRALLQLMTPVFNSMISSNGGSDNTKDGLVVVPIMADSIALSRLLLIIYHYADVPDARDALYLDIGLIARKYNMQIIEKQLRRQLHASHLITEEPLRAYCIAVNFGWGDEARLAASNTLIKPLQDLAYSNELKRISGADFYHLLKYRFRCVNAVEQIFENMDKKDPPQLITNLRDKMKAQPRSISVMGDSNLHDAMADVVGSLSSGGMETIDTFLRCCRVLVAAVEEAVSKVVLDFENRTSSSGAKPCQKNDTPPTS